MNTMAWGRFSVYLSGMCAVYCGRNVATGSFLVAALCATASLGLYVIGINLTERGSARP